jgi:outer membrane protein assembly factor BamB
MITPTLLAVLLAPVPAESVAAPPLAPAWAAPAALVPALAQDRAWEAALGSLRHTRLTAARVADGHIIVQDEDGGLTALDPATGLTRWFVRLPGPLERWPAGGGGTLVLVAGGEVLVVDAASGRRLAHVESPDVPAGSPVSDGHLLFTPTLVGNRLVATDLDLGVKRWEFRFGAPLDGPAMLLGEQARRTVIVATDDGVVHAIAAQPEAPRTERWIARTGRLAGPAVSDGQRVFVATEDRSVLALDTGTGSTLWRYLPGETLTGGPVLSGDTLVVGTDARVVALDATTGAERWKRDVADRPLAASGSVIQVARGGEVALLDASDGHDLRTGLPKATVLAEGVVVERLPESLVATKLQR